MTPRSPRRRASRGRSSPTRAARRPRPPACESYICEAALGVELDGRHARVDQLGRWCTYCDVGVEVRREPLPRRQRREVDVGQQDVCRGDVVDRSPETLMRGPDRARVTRGERVGRRSSRVLRGPPRRQEDHAARRSTPRNQARGGVLEWRRARRSTHATGGPSREALVRAGHPGDGVVGAPGRRRALEPRGARRASSRCAPRGAGAAHRRALARARCGDPDAGVRREALAARRRARPRPTRAGEAVARRLGDDDALVVEAACLRARRARAHAAVVALVPAPRATTTTRGVREAAVAALGAIGDERGLAAVHRRRSTTGPACAGARSSRSPPSRAPRSTRRSRAAREDRDWQVRAGRRGHGAEGERLAVGVAKERVQRRHLSRHSCRPRITDEVGVLGERGPRPRCAGEELGQVVSLGQAPDEVSARAR